MQHPNSPFEPDVLIREELAGQQQRTGELRFVAAILSTALWDLQSPHAEIAADARQWILEPQDESWPYTFEHVCGWLGIEPEWLRQIVRKFIEGWGDAN